MARSARCSWSLIAQVPCRPRTRAKAVTWACLVVFLAEMRMPVSSCASRIRILRCVSPEGCCVVLSTCSSRCTCQYRESLSVKQKIRKNCLTLGSSIIVETADPPNRFHLWVLQRAFSVYFVIPRRSYWRLTSADGSVQVS